MISIVLDGTQVSDREEMHKIFRDALGLEDFYGCNMDALYDVLSTYSEPIEINLLEEEALYANVPFYAERLVELIKVAAEENEPYIIIKRGEDCMEEELW